MAPIILLTPTDGMAPMVLGSLTPSTQPKWNLKLLVFFWVTQAIILLWRGFICFWAMVGMMILDKPVYFLLFVGNNIGNIVFLTYIVVEIHQYRTEMLEIRQYYKKQIQKMIFVGLGVFFLLQSDGSETLILTDFLVDLLAKGIICVPFIGSLYYGRRLLLEDIRGAAEEEQLGMLRRQNLSPV